MTLPKLPHPRKILNYKIRNLMIVNDNLSRGLPPEIECVQIIHKRVLMGQIMKLKNEVGEFN